MFVELPKVLLRVASPVEDQGELLGLPPQGAQPLSQDPLPRVGEVGGVVAVARVALVVEGKARLSVLEQRSCVSRPGSPARYGC